MIAGFYHFGNLLLRDATGHGTSTAFLALLVTAISVWITWPDVEISARLMLRIEAVSVSLILIVVTLVLVRLGGHLDWQQFQLGGMIGSGLRLGLVLVLFSFVGFESATTLGSEGRNPLKTISKQCIAVSGHRPGAADSESRVHSGITGKTRVCTTLSRDLRAAHISI